METVAFLLWTLLCIIALFVWWLLDGWLSSAITTKETVAPVAPAASNPSVSAPETVQPKSPRPFDISGSLAGIDAAFKRAWEQQLQDAANTKARKKEVERTSWAAKVRAKEDAVYAAERLREWQQEEEERAKKQRTRRWPTVQIPCAAKKIESPPPPTATAAETFEEGHGIEQEVRPVTPASVQHPIAVEKAETPAPANTNTTTATEMVEQQTAEQQRQLEQQGIAEQQRQLEQQQQMAEQQQIAEQQRQAEIQAQIQHRSPFTVQYPSANEQPPASASTITALQPPETVEMQQSPQQYHQPVTPAPSEKFDFTPLTPMAPRPSNRTARQPLHRRKEAAVKEEVAQFDSRWEERKNERVVMPEPESDIPAPQSTPALPDTTTQPATDTADAPATRSRASSVSSTSSTLSEVPSNLVAPEDPPVTSTTIDYGPKASPSNLPKKFFNPGTDPHAARLMYDALHGSSSHQS